MQRIEMNVVTGKQTIIPYTPEEEAVYQTALAADLAAAFPNAKAAFIKQVDSDTDALIKAVIGERASEYELAEKEATAFKVAGYTGTVPASVQSDATAKGTTATVACDNILAVAASWRTAQAALRANRLARKAEAKVAADAPALDAIKASWSGFLAALKTQMGV